MARVLKAEVEAIFMKSITSLAFTFGKTSKNDF